jgi:hypothetical protein
MQSPPEDITDIYAYRNMRYQFSVIYSIRKHIVLA